MTVRASMYRRAHVYGPHDPNTAPGRVTVFRSEAEGGDYQTGVPDALVRQREQLNSIAWSAAQ